MALSLALACETSSPHADDVGLASSSDADPDAIVDSVLHGKGATCLVAISVDGTTVSYDYDDGEGVTLYVSVSPNGLTGELTVAGEVTAGFSAIEEKHYREGELWYGGTAPMKVTLRRDEDDLVTGSIDGFALAPFQASDVSDDFVPALADGLPWPSSPAAEAQLRAALEGAFGMDAKCQLLETSKSVPSHPGFPPSSTQACTDCHAMCRTNRDICLENAGIQCLRDWSWIPIIGPFAFSLCFWSSAANCNNLGFTPCTFGCDGSSGPCCPVSCGSVCCGLGESCLGQDQCCPANTTVCPGPAASCRASDEVCMPNGTSCTPARACGQACCAVGYHCLNESIGVCFPD